MHRLFAAFLSLALAAPVLAGTTIDLAAEASRPAANDLARATLFSEASGANPAELARRINQEIGEALKLIRAKAGVTVKSGAQSTYPVYNPGRKIETWRMRSELIVESRDAAAMSELIGQLQQMRLALADLSQMPSPETRRQVEDDTTRDAIEAFRQRATLLGEQLGKPWRIKHLSVQQGGQPMPRFRVARAMAMEAAAPAPIEAGDSLLTTTVSGQIELAD